MPRSMVNGQNTTQMEVARRASDRAALPSAILSSRCEFAASTASPPARPRVIYDLSSSSEIDRPSLDPRHRLVYEAKQSRAWYVGHSAAAGSHASPFAHEAPNYIIAPSTPSSKYLA